MKTSSRTASFGPYSLDLRSGELKKFGTRVKIGEQAFQILCLLINSPGELVTREELRIRLWPSDTFVDFDHGLNSAVQRLRDCLSDTAINPHWIETVPRRGYRFVGAVEWSEGSTNGVKILVSDNAIRDDVPNGYPNAIEAANPLETQPGANEVPVSSIRGSRIRVLVSSGAAVITIALLVVAGLNQERMRAIFNPRPIQSVAVLPLVDLSADGNQGFLADGMTEELTTDLGKISALRVISRTSVMQYRGTRKSLSEIAQALHVDAVVEGTVARSGDHLRITANLVQTSPEKHLWAESYDREVGDALTVQGQIAQAIARQIQVKLTQPEQKLLSASHPVNLEAQDFYLRGLYVFRAGSTADASSKAIHYFQQAIEKDPNYAPAYAALADVYSVWIPGMTRPRELMPKAKLFAQKALELDDTLAEAHSVLGSVALLYDWDWAAAEKEYKEAIALNPNHVWSHEWHARQLVTEGRANEAVEESNLALAISPSPLTWDYPTWVFFLAHRNDLASDRAKALVEVAPDWPWGHFELAQIYEAQRDLQKSAQESLRADELFGLDSQKLERRRRALINDGYRGYWRRIREDYEASAKTEYVPSVMVAEACLRVGDKESALQWLERGYQERDDLMVNLAVEPILADLQSDPRFQNLVQRVGAPVRK